MEKGLYITATPIGNARDITLRALDVLGNCDAIVAEDTRTTAKLLAIHGISRAVISYNDHNGPRVRPQILARLKQGERLALVSDAGTPLISDPGYKLVREAIAAGIKVHALPGPSAAIAALVMSGLPTDRFLFAGFLPVTRAARRNALESLKVFPCTLVFFEAPQRLSETLEDMYLILQGRHAAVTREMTKLHEDVCRGNLQQLMSFYKSSRVRGEVTVIVGPPRESEEADFSKADQLLEKAMAFMPARAAVDLVVEALGLPRKEVYARALLQKKSQPGEN